MIQTKPILIGLSLAVALSLSACSKSKEANPPQGGQQQQQGQQQATQPDHVTTAGGLGDTADYLKTKYGENASKQPTAGSYKNNSIQVMFNDNRATSIQLAFDKTDKPRRTMEEAQSLISSMLPADIKKIQDTKDDKTGAVGAIYESSTLAKVFANSYKQAEDVAKKIGGKAPKAGTCSVKILKDQKGVSAIILGLGDQL